MEPQLPTWHIDPNRVIGELERRDLDGVLAGDDPIWGRFTDLPFVRVRGVATHWEDSPAAVGEAMADLLAGVYGLRANLLFLVVGQQSPQGVPETAVYVALEQGDGDEAGLEPLLRNMLTALFPGILLGETIAQPGQGLAAAGYMANRGVLCGVPALTTPRPAGPDGATDPGGAARQPRDRAAYRVPIDRVIRAMQGEQWAFLLRAEPVRHDSINGHLTRRLEQATQLASQSRFQQQSVSQEMRANEKNVQTGTTQSFSRELVDRPTQYALTLCEQEIERLRRARQVGLWRVEAHYCAATAAACARMSVLFISAVSGSELSADRIRATACQPSGRPLEAFVTLLTSPELASLVHLPLEETQGYRLAPYARFDTDLPTEAIADGVVLGDIIDGSRPTGAAFAIPASDLVRHALVTGMTGSGKTTTLFGLLLDLHERGIPFLVIEPAKAEYRHLLGANSAEPAGPILDLRVYTLGDETVAPLRLNPFEFEIRDTRHRVHVQTHIDYLKAVFNAAFILYAPMPYVLDVCLHEIYTDRGWNLTTGLNIRLDTAGDYQHLDRYPVFPTLADLYAKIDEVVARLGYEERIEMDVSAGLRARIGSLLLGSKGLMLNCRRGVPFAELLGRPTVLELERIGNDDEKAFLIGLILTRLYEYRRVQASMGADERFRHLLVIEEAHRLLKNVSTEIPVEGANNRGQAIETFTNILSEIRSYGQGIAIAEQIPTKLAADAIKNTNLKLIHRLVAADDRRLLGETTNMSERQSSFLSTLRQGVCVAHTEGADYPYLIKPADARRLRVTGRTTDDGLSLVMGPAATDAEREASPDLHSLDLYLDSLAFQIAESDDFDEVWSALLLRIIDDPRGDLWSPLARARLLVHATAGRLSATAEMRLLRQLLRHAAATSLDRRSRRYRWSFSTQQQLVQLLTDGLLALLDKRFDEAQTALSRFAEQHLASAAVVEGPFPGCASCSVRCQLRSDVAPIVAWPSLRRDVLYLLNTADDLNRVGPELRGIMEQALAQRAGPLAAGLQRRTAICLCAQLVNRLSFSRYTQQLLTRQLDATYDVAAVVSN